MHAQFGSLFHKHFHEKPYRDRMFYFYSEEERKTDKSKKEAFAYSFIAHKKAPLFIVVPGGAYAVVAADHEGVAFAKELNQKGYNAVVLIYRVGKNAHFPHPQQDFAKLISYIYAHPEKFGFDGNYAIVGFSAGGHLCASFATKLVGYEHFNVPKPKACILGYPVITMGSKTHPGSKKNLIMDRDEEIIHYSAEKQADGDYPPTYIWCCADDKCVPPYNTEIMTEKLLQVNVPVQKEIFSKGGHGIGLGKGTEAGGWFDRAVAFVVQYFC